MAAQNTETYVHETKDILTHFDLMAGDKECWFSTGSGDAGMFDLRAASKVKLYSLSAKKINTIHINPTSQRHIIVCGLDRTIKLFDVRKLVVGGDDLIEPLIEMDHGKSVNSAYWDPQGIFDLTEGKLICSTSFDDTVAIWSDAITSPLKVSIRHNNNTGIL